MRLSRNLLAKMSLKLLHWRAAKVTEYPVAAAATVVPTPSQTPHASATAVSQRHSLCGERFVVIRTQTEDPTPTPRNL